MLKFVDIFTVATCRSKPGSDLTDASKLLAVPFSCVAEADKHRCIDSGYACETDRDGYYYVNALCVIIGIVTFVAYIRPAVIRLQDLPLRAWRLAK